MIYWDTSCVLKLYVSESDSSTWEERALATDEEFAASALLETELAYGLIRKEARGDIKQGAAEALLTLFRQDVERARFTLYPGKPPIINDIRPSTGCRMTNNWKTPITTTIGNRSRRLLTASFPSA